MAWAAAACGAGKGSFVAAAAASGCGAGRAAEDDARGGTGGDGVARGTGGRTGTAAGRRAARSCATSGTSLGGFQPSMPSFQTWTSASLGSATSRSTRTLRAKGPCWTPSSARNHSMPSPSGGGGGGVGRLFWFESISAISPAGAGAMLVRSPSSSCASPRVASGAEG
jgi:hypothetical protein